MAHLTTSGFQRNVEMVRRHRIDGLAVTEVAALFGVSRQTVYNVTRAYDDEGLAGLVPAKSGPRDGFKCTTEIVDYLLRCLRRDATLAATELARKVESRFGVALHPNTIRYALAKRRPQTPQARPSQARKAS
jgi:transposase